MAMSPIGSPPSGGGGSISDVLSVMRNIVTAINDAASIYLAVNGAQNSSGISATTLVSQKTGRLCQLSVSVAGSALGTIYDSNNINSLVNPICVIPTAVGVYEINIPVGIGIVVVPGTGQTLTVTWS